MMPSIPLLFSLLQLFVPLLPTGFFAVFTIFFSRIFLFRRKFLFEKNWVEKARLLYPFKKSISMVNGISLVMSTYLAYFFHEHFSSWSLSLHLSLAFLCWYFTVSFIGYRYSLFWTYRYYSVGEWFYGALSGLLSSWFLILIVGLFFYLPNQWGLSFYLSMFGVFVFVFFMQQGGLLAVLKLFGIVQPLDSYLKEALKETERKMGVIPRALFKIRSFAPNALAYPQLRVILFTTGILETFSVDELKSIYAHELGHLKENMWPTVFRSLSVHVFLFLFFLKPLFFPPYQFEWVLWLFVVVLCLIVFFLKLIKSWSVKWEKNADHHAHEHESDVGSYALALEKVYRLGLVPVVLNKNKTHPDLYDRLLSAGVQPTYSRPLPPDTKKNKLVMFLLFIILVLVVTSLEFLATIFVSAG